MTSEPAPQAGVSSVALWGAIAAFGLGLAGFRQLSFLLPPWALTLPLIVALVGLFRFPRRGTAVAAALMAGFWWQGITAIGQHGHPFPEAWERKTVRASGWIAGPVADKGRRQRFRFKVERLRGPDGDWRPYRGTLRLSWYEPVPRDLAYGQRWQFSVRARRPRGFRNPGGFDYAGYLRARGLSGTGYIRSDPAPDRRPGVAGNPLRRGLEGARRRIQEAVAGAGGEGAPLLRALTVGKRDRLDATTWETLRRTGTAHLVAISGLHVGWVAILAFAAAGWLWRRLPGAALRLPAPRFAALAALTTAGGYAALAGFGLPTQRALIMIGVGLGAWLFGRPFRFERALAVAALAVLVWDPDSLFAPGFWLSFTAVAGIGLLLAGPLRNRGKVTATLAIQVLVVLMVSPWLAYWFGQLSVVAPLANLIAVPVFTFLVVPLALAATVAALMGVAVFYGPAFAGAGWLLARVAEGLARLGDLPFAAWQGPRPDVMAVAFMLAGLAVLFAGRGGWRLAGPVVALLPLAWMGPPHIPEGQARVWVLDVGQGSAAVVETAERVAVVDCGPRFSPRFDAGSAMVAPFLHHRGWSEVHRLVVSHGDADHNGGCSGLRARIPVRSMAGAPEAFETGGRVLDAGDGWQWDRVQFEVLAPEPPGPREGNNASRVLRIRAGGDSLLLPGDLEAAGERRLLAEVGDVDSDVVVAPHHGSNTSSTESFVKGVGPGVVVFSTGYKNQWGLPEPEVVARYRRAGAAVWRTARSGAVRVRLGDGVQVAGYRQRADGYWHDGSHPPPMASLASLVD